MNVSIIPYDENPDLKAVLGQILESMREMTPQLRIAAQFALDHPNDIGVGSIREIADAAGVTPNTLVRMARATGFGGYEEFREPFREALRAPRDRFPDRARWLQSIARRGAHGPLHRDIAAQTLGNIEALFATISTARIKDAADHVVDSRVTYVLGVGVLNALAQNFAYLARMALDRIVAIPRPGSLAADDLAAAGPRDVLIAMTFHPYRTEVIEAARMAHEQGVRVIAIADRPSAALFRYADHPFVVPVETPQFFTSTVAVTSLLETIMAFVVADAEPEVIAAVEAFHRRRHEAGVYWDEANN